MKNQTHDFWKEYYIYSAENTALASGNGTAFIDTDVKLDLDADWELTKRSHVALDPRILLTFKDDITGRNYQNVPMDLRMISGGPVSDITIGSTIQVSGLLPYILPLPVVFRRSGNITAAFSDYSGALNSIRLALHGSKIREGKAPWQKPWRRRLYFDYVATTILAASDTSSITIPINQDSDFIVKKITGLSEHPYVVTVQDGATDKQWMDKPVHSQNFVGNAHFPNILPSPRFIYRGSVIYLTIQNLVAKANTIRIVFSGEKLFG